MQGTSPRFSIQQDGGGDRRISISGHSSGDADVTSLGTGTEE